MTEPTPTDLRSFLAVADAPNLTIAADQLHSTQSTLTRRIQRLEHYVGASLFERRHRSLILNARGRALHDHATVLVAEFDAMRSHINRLVDPERGLVRLDFMHSLGTWMVPDILHDYRAQHPQVTFELHQGAARVLMERVLADEADVALIGPQPDASDIDAGLSWHQLERQALAIALPVAHPSAHVTDETGRPSPIKMQELASEDFIGMLPGYGTRVLLDRLTAQAGFSPNLVFESMELTTVIGLVSAGLGVALVPIDDPYLAPRNVVLRPLDPPYYRELGMVWRSQAEPSPPVDQFRSFIIDGGFQSDS